LGKTRYAIIYLTTGILASLSSLYFHEPAVSIGASGAIFGLYGVFLSLLLTNVFPKDFSKAFLVSTLIFIGYNLLMGFAGAGIDNAAHIGGLLSGFIIGIILYPQLKRQAGDEQMLEPVEPQKYD
jgi:rhomboid protease GluP